MDKSENITELVKALIGMQPQLQPAIKDKANPFFKAKYADLAGVVESSRQLLSMHRLAISQVSSIDATGPYLETILMHESGQWISGKYPLKPVKDDPQAMGSAMTYARRYTWAAILGIVTEDDDAEGAMGRQETKTKTETKTNPPASAGPVPGSDPWIIKKVFDLKIDAVKFQDYLTSLGLTAGTTIQDTLTKNAQLLTTDKRAAIAKKINVTEKAEVKAVTNG